MAHSLGSGDYSADVEMDCTIYVDVADPGSALSLLSGALNVGSESRGVLVYAGVRVYGAHNDYEMMGAQNDFTQWATVLECEPFGGSLRNEVVAAIAEMLQAIWMSGHRAVAACRFEDQLPEGGGLRLYP
ncbi:hypothetical protein [Streptomyces sp. NPDC050982]|uniref:hypothetical protein n=1 Tax=Streptomyces sp. NPDC050982 TaxID=3154746 RepID=UPI00340226F0